MVKGSLGRSVLLACKEVGQGLLLTFVKVHEYIMGGMLILNVIN